MVEPAFPVVEAAFPVVEPVETLPGVSTGSTTEGRPAVELSADRTGADCLPAAAEVT
ncbi:hypothetical protein QF038_002464 [Pseudarthrobacter sp. W1I19]|uniref:hypothetical protein n=1 Tax=Pseudarthrobacter sp. W1I19 TaxID=3042288 RepID=UPI002782F705|nr:hypothetical protein [Pseudarthrobacter sp. W1I19]MDQ0923956.1 hypothetical protein [Pseudarthrobacter sp. W1I19]